MHREAFQFSSTYLWVSMGSGMRYKQVVVSVLAAVADDAALVATPRAWPISYEERGPTRTQALGTGKLNLEWMEDPEPRYPLLVPLGLMRPPGPGAANRPRPRGDGTPGSGRVPGIGWREYADGRWQFDNRDNAYRPFEGLAATLAARQQDVGEVFFYFAHTVRVQHETDPARLQSLDWFFATVPQVQRRWHDGTLVGPGLPLADAGTR